MTLEETLDEIVAHLHASGINAEREGAKISAWHPEDRDHKLVERVTAFAAGTTYYMRWSWGERAEIVDAHVIAGRIANVVTPDAALQTT